ncbi:MAG: hypothetical protein JWN95_735 [Frankiales bacterium]|nr:hypothetical protein [Frankiales bacterium]
MDVVLNSPKKSLKTDQHPQPLQISLRGVRLLPVYAPKHEPDLGALKVIMGRVNQPRRENSRDGIVAAVQGAALAFFGDIGEFY